MWPVQLADGRTASFDGWTVWMVLSAPALPDPDLRHGIARIRLMSEKDTIWRDCGNALPDGLNPGSREWAGSAVFDPGSGVITLFYTVAGFHGEVQPSYAQRLFQTRGKLTAQDGAARITDWTDPAESVRSDGVRYIIVDQKQGIPGFIKGFRDPAHFRDPASGCDYLLFTGSLAGSASDWNGCIGLAEAADASCNAWTLLDPLIAADGLNNEQERPHIVFRDGRYYLFWSTQRKVFAPGAPNGPNGLYGMVADTLFGPYVPLNGTGLVAANPHDEPFQTYSWWVTADLEVAGFADLLGVGQGPVIDDPAWRRAHFGGVPAPRFRIALDGERAWVAS
jgi:levansucrase